MLDTLDITVTNRTGAFYEIKVRYKNSENTDRQPNPLPGFDSDIENILRRELNADYQLETIEDVGRSLFKFLFSNNSYALYLKWNESNAVEGKSVRLKFDCDPVHRLRIMPWEALHDGIGFLSIRTGVQIAANFNGFDVVQSKLAQPRILIAVSAPTILPRSRTVGYQEELSRIFSAIDTGEYPDVQVSYLSASTISALKSSIVENAPNIVHFIGHGGYSRAENMGYLVFEDESGAEEPVSAESIASVITSSGHVSLVILNSCHSAKLSRCGGLEGVAFNLHDKGVPAVIGMRSSIYDKEAIDFSSAFYESILQGSTAEAAAASGRRAIAGNDSNPKAGFIVPTILVNSTVSFKHSEVSSVTSATTIRKAAQNVSRGLELRYIEQRLLSNPTIGISIRGPDKVANSSILDVLSKHLVETSLYETNELLRLETLDSTLHEKWQVEAHIRLVVIDEAKNDALSLKRWFSQAVNSEERSFQILSNISCDSHCTNGRLTPIYLPPLDFQNSMQYVSNACPTTSIERRVALIRTVGGLPGIIDAVLSLGFMSASSANEGNDIVYRVLNETEIYSGLASLNEAQETAIQILAIARTSIEHESLILLTQKTSNCNLESQDIISMLDRGLISVVDIAHQFNYCSLTLLDNTIISQLEESQMRNIYAVLYEFYFSCLQLTELHTEKSEFSELAVFYAEKTDNAYGAWLSEFLSIDYLHEYNTNYRIDRCNSLLDRLVDTPEAARHLLEVNVRSVLAALLSSIGNTDGARQQYERTLLLTRNITDPKENSGKQLQRLRGDALVHISRIASVSNSASINYLSEARMIRDSLGEPDPRLLLQLSRVSFLTGDESLSLSPLIESFQLAKNQSDVTAELDALSASFELEVLLPDFDSLSLQMEYSLARASSCQTTSSSANLLRAVGRYLSKIDPPRAKDLLEEAIRFAEPAGDNRIAISCYDGLTEVHASLMELPEASAAMRSIIGLNPPDLSERIERLELSAAKLRSIGNNFRIEGNYLLARKYLLESGRAFETAGKRSEYLSCMLDTSVLNIDMGNIELALTDLKELRRICLIEGHQHLGITSLHEIGLIYLKQGKIDEARSCFQNCKAEADRASLHDRGIASMHMLGVICCSEGRNLEAEKILEECLEISRSHSAELGIIDTLAALANVKLESGNTLETRKHIAEVLKLSRKNDYKHGIALGMYLAGRALIQDDRVESGLRRLKAAHNLARQYSDPFADDLQTAIEAFGK
ncbi:MAG: CHAT domain-containing protein [Pseudomonadota bacterium]